MYLAVDRAYPPAVYIISKGFEMFWQYTILRQEIFLSGGKVVDGNIQTIRH